MKTDKIKISMISFKSFLTLFTLLLTILPSAFAAEKNSTILSTASLWDRSGREEKVKIVRAVIDKFKKDGIVIRKEPAFYAEEVDAFRGDNPESFALPIGAALRTIFIMYRDFDNGQDPNELIREVSSEEQYEQYLEGNSAFILELNYQDWRAQQGLTEKE